MQPLRRRKVISVAYSETVSVAAGTWREMRMHHIVICCLFDSSIFYHIIWQTTQLQKILLSLKCVLLFFTRVSETFVILRRNEGGMIKKNKYLTFTWNAQYSCQMLVEHEFSRQIFEKFQVPNFMKIRPLGAKSFHADGRTDGHEEVKSLKWAIAVVCL